MLLTDLAPGSQPVPSQHNHYPVSVKTASGSVHVSVLVFKPSISHVLVHVYNTAVNMPSPEPGHNTKSKPHSFDLVYLTL